MKKITEAVCACFKSCQENQCQYFVGADFPAFEGHFPSQPILPAVVQIQFALDALNRLYQTGFVLKTVSKAKFSRPVPPNTLLTVNAVQKAPCSFMVQLALPDGQKCGQVVLEVEQENETH